MNRLFKWTILAIFLAPIFVFSQPILSYSYFHSHPSYFPTQRLAASFMTEDFFAWDSFLELEDGSRWSFDYSDKYKIYHWYPEDEISITQNTSWFGSHHHTLVNHTRRDSIDVTLTRGPLKGAPLHRFIVAIDLSNNLVVLNDHSTWQIHPDDFSSFRKWALYDTIIIGFNSSWGSSTHEGFLTNVNMNNYLRARQ